MSEFTFKPIAGKKFRCNQTGDIVKKCQAYKRRMNNMDRTVPPAVVTSKVVTNWQSAWPYW